MNTKISLIALLILGSISFSGCFLGGLIDCVSANGTTTTQSYTLPAFSAIELRTDVDLTISQSSTQSVDATGSDNLLNLLDISVVNDRLIIEVDECLITSDLSMDIAVDSLEAIEILGSGNVTIPQTFVTDDLELNIGGSGDMELMLDAEDISVEIRGSGNVALEGTAVDLALEIAGSGDIQAFDLPATNAYLEILGSGSMEVNLSGNLDGKISGSGDIYYKGSPSINVQINGSGEIVDAN
jgi:hypothetical protein